MKRLIILTSMFSYCTSGSDQSMRNKDIFDEAAQLNYPIFTKTPLSFDGGIQALNTTINAFGNTSEQTVSITIEGIVTLPSSFGFGLGVTTTDTVAKPMGCSSGCSDGTHTTSVACTGAGAVWSTQADQIFSRSFVLQDANAGILVAYGLEPPISDTAQSASMKYISNARTPNMAILGDRMRITVTRVRRYGNTTGAAPTNTVPLVTDFSSRVIVSSRNQVPYSAQTAAFSKATDLYRVRQLEGYVTVSPSHVECGSGTDREFQFNYQKGYRGTICIGASSYADAQTCSGAKTPMNFQLSYNLGAGTLSGFDTGNSFSYNIAAGSKVRLTGSVFNAKFGGADSELALMLDQKVQVETLK